MSPDKANLSERDVCTKFILPALEAAGWDRQTQLFEEFPLRVGRVVVRGNKGKRDPGTVRRADYVLFRKLGIPLAVIEAKDANHGVRDGIQQALAYAEMLDVPFAFSSNGEGFLFHDGTGADGIVEREIALGEFPSPAELWSRYAAWKNCRLSKRRCWRRTTTPAEGIHDCRPPFRRSRVPSPNNPASSPPSLP